MEERNLVERTERSTPLAIGQFGEQALDIVKEASLLTPDNMEALVEMREELQHTWEHKQMWRTECEIRNSVLVDTKFPTPDAKYWQAVREQDVFFGELVRLSYEYRKLQQDLKIAEAEKMELEDKLAKAQEEDSPEYVLIKLEAEIEKQKIDLDEKIFQVKNMQLAARDRMREIKIWSKVKEELEPHLQYGIESPNDHQHMSYFLRFHNMVRNNLVTGGFKGSSVGEINNMIGQYEQLMKDPANSELVDKLELAEAKAELEEQKRRLIEGLGYDPNAAGTIGQIAPPSQEKERSRPVLDFVSKKKQAGFVPAPRAPKQKPNALEVDQ